MNDNEILETGALCEALLSSMHFSTIVTQYELTIAADILATKPEDNAKREELYHSLWGARGLLSYMKLNADAAAKIKEPKPQTDVTTDYTYDYEVDGSPRDEEYD